MGKIDVIEVMGVVSLEDAANQFGVSTGTLIQLLTNPGMPHTIHQEYYFTPISDDNGSVTGYKVHKRANDENLFTFELPKPSEVNSEA